MLVKADYDYELTQVDDVAVLLRPDLPDGLGADVLLSAAPPRHRPQRALHLLRPFPPAHRTNSHDRSVCCHLVCLC